MGGLWEKELLSELGDRLHKEGGSWFPQEEGEERLLEQGGQTGSPSPEIRNLDRVSPQVLC